MAGMKYKDIAEKYNTTINTVKSWKKRYGWNRKEGAPKKEKGCTQNRVGAPAHPVQIDDGTKETLRNEDLTPEQQMFCIYYIRTFNAAQSYQKAFGCSYVSALANGPRLLGNDKVRTEIERLKEIKRQMIVSGTEDIVDLQMRIAFSDIGEYLSFGQKPGLKGNANVVCLNDSGKVDTQLIQEIKQGKEGVSVKLADRQKAIDWLSRYFLIHPDDKYKAEFDRKRVEPENSDTDENVHNGFVDALKAQAESVMAETGEIIETENIIQV